MLWVLDLQVDLLFKQHQNMLKALYSRYRLRPSGGGLRPKVLKLDGWLALMAVSEGPAADMTSEACCRIRVTQLVQVLGLSLQLAHKCWLQRACMQAVTAEPGCAAAAVSQEARLIDSQFTLVDATLAFLWSRMFVIDEIKDYVR